ncbi:WD40 repeat-like protein [Dacryopinax primogenitus]|uniref:WD40 repeat-like protein n=1 Tax=Dacryopinax primogenitus (strain DJM 731) TaxID=1858805 RepID=M5G307_DACPD|nr:WD40 repeat-like protein [Dacryopinax primogenitus]EJU04611.1 WD40 repeat-like protein [Dacryopinax primogenitus]
MTTYMYGKPSPSKDNRNQRGPPGTSMPITPATIARLRPARVFQKAVDPAPPSDPSAPHTITSLSFDNTGEFLVTAGEDEAFRLYNCRQGKLVKPFWSKKYGVDLATFTHKSTTILHASTKEDNTVRYHSLHDNRYLQYFKGHQRRVICIQMSPVDDTFLTSSLDKTVRLWDLRSPTCRGLLNLPRAPVVAYDNTGVVFAVALSSPPRIALYDASAWDTEPFLSVELNDTQLAQRAFPPRVPVVTSLQFSSNGKWLLVGTAGEVHYVLDSFNGDLLARLEGHQGLERGKHPGAAADIVPRRGISGQEVTFTPDSKFVISGSHTGRWHAWDLLNKEETMSGALVGKEQEVRTVLPSFGLEGHSAPVRCVRWNPRFAMMATAGEELAFWLPERKFEPPRREERERRPSGDVRMDGR